MPDIGDIQPLPPVWPIRPADGDGKRKRPTPDKDPPPAADRDKKDEGPGHVDEYAAGE
jgi:hypothetical protein